MLNAQSGITGIANSAAVTIARRRPIRSENAPNVSPPTIAPRFAIITSVLTV